MNERPIGLGGLIMTKNDIVSILAEGTGLTKLETGAVIDGFIATIRYALKKQDRVDLRGFGSFQVVTRKARKARNPRTGEMMSIAEKKVPVFRSATDFKKFVNKDNS